MELEVLLLALFIDIVVREPPGIKIHPVVWIGNSIEKNWRKLRNDPVIERINGVVFSLTYIIIPATLVYFALEFLKADYIVYIIASAVILNYCISFSAFFDTVKPVKKSLEKGELTDAREHVKHLVTRDVSGLTDKQVISATIESLGENICDALISPLFYFILFGVPGAVAMRIINLLDGKLGHRTPEKKNIGWFPARLDDLLQFIPARITGLLMVLSAILLGNPSNSIRVLLRDRSKDDGINSGWTIASLAGALNVQVEKPDTYRMGDPNEELSIKKIDRALLFVPTTLVSFVILGWVIT